MAMKYALIYPPEFDGELHVKVEDEPNGPLVKRTVTVVLSVSPEESVGATLRKLGRDLANQPLRTRPE